MENGHLFAAMPSSLVLLTPDLVIAAVNPAFVAGHGLNGDDVLGRPLFEVFPPAEDDPDPGGELQMRRSFARVLASGEPDVIPLARLMVRDPGSGAVVERYWSLVHFAIRGDDGTIQYVAQRAEDVTDYIAGLSQAPVPAGKHPEATAPGAPADQTAVAAMLLNRSRELQDAIAAEAVATHRATALAETALLVATAETETELVALVVTRGMEPLGADGCGLGLLDGNRQLIRYVRHLTGGPAAWDERFAELPLSAGLPSAVSARTGAVVALQDEIATRAYSPETRAALDGGGLPASVSVPLPGPDGTLGSLTLGWAEPHTVTASELAVLNALAAQTALGLQRLRVRDGERERAAATRTMSELLQRSLLTEPQRTGAFDVEVRYRPATVDAQVGGDWHDCFVTVSGATCVAIGDATGHNQEAAAVMGQLRNLLRGIAYVANEPPSHILTMLDSAVRDLDVGSLATCVFARVEETDDQNAPGILLFRWSNAGHPPPLLLRPDGTTELLETDSDLLLGVDPESPRADHTRLLQPGDAVLLFTDGLVERRGASVETGLAWLADAASQLAGKAPGEILDALLEQVDSDTDDDVAVLALRAHPRNISPAPESQASLGFDRRST